MEFVSDVMRRSRFEALAETVVEPTRRYLRRRTDPDTADDVLADTLLVVWRRLEDVPDNDALPWVIGVAKWQLANTHRTFRRTERLSARVATTSGPQVTTDHADTVADQSVVTQAMAQLSATDAELLRLWAWDDLSPAQIAAVLNVSTNAVSIRLHRARHRLRKILRKLDAAPGHEPDEEGDRT